MNPDTNNPSANPFADSVAPVGPDPTAGLNDASIPDSLAAAQENLTAASLSVGQDSGSINPEQANSNEANPVLSSDSEPLVPAAPVPGSIGSAISMPAAEPMPAPAFANPGASPVAAMPEPNTASPTASASVAAPVPEPSINQTTPDASMNSETPGAAASASPAVNAPAANTPAAAPATPYNPFAAKPAAAPASAAAPTATASQAAAPVAPMSTLSQLTQKPKKNLLAIILGAAAAIFLILTIVFFIQWQKEKDNVKKVYLPTESSESSNALVQTLSCQRGATIDDPSGSGTDVVSVTYSDDIVSALSSVLSLSFASEDDARIVQERNAEYITGLGSAVATSLSVSDSVDGASYTRTITSEDGTSVTPADAMTVIYGSSEGEPSIALADIQAKYEADGFVCTEE